MGRAKSIKCTDLCFSTPRHHLNSGQLLWGGQEKESDFIPFSNPTLLGKIPNPKAFHNHPFQELPTSLLKVYSNFANKSLFTTFLLFCDSFAIYGVAS
jgi:hypothetical protein